MKNLTMLLFLALVVFAAGANAQGCFNDADCSHYPYQGCIGGDSGQVPPVYGICVGGMPGGNCPGDCGCPGNNQCSCGMNSSNDGWGCNQLGDKVLPQGHPLLPLLRPRSMSIIPPSMRPVTPAQLAELDKAVAARYVIKRRVVGVGAGVLEVAGLLD